MILKHLTQAMQDQTAAKEKPNEKRGIITTISSLQPLIQGLLLAAVGTVATIIYNQRQLELAQFAALDKYRVYLTSDNPQERVFGYQAFVALGQEQFVIRLIAAKKEPAGEHVLTSLASSANDEATRKEAETNLQALLADTAKQAALGRQESAQQDLNQIIKLAPENQTARLQRNTLEDWRYLVQASSKLDPKPYLELAKYSAEQGDTQEARSLLQKASALFDDTRILDVSIDYNPAEIDMRLYSRLADAKRSGWVLEPTTRIAQQRLLAGWQSYSGVGTAAVSSRTSLQPVRVRFDLCTGDDQRSE